MKHLCPYCHRPVDLRTRLHYLLRGTAYYVSCPHCGQRIHPAREPIPFLFCSFSSALLTFLSFWAYICFVEDSFWGAVGFAALLALIYCAMIAVLTMRRIEFDK